VTHEVTWQDKISATCYRKMLSMRVTMRDDEKINGDVMAGLKAHQGAVRGAVVVDREECRYVADRRQLSR